MAEASDVDMACDETPERGPLPGLWPGGPAPDLSPLLDERRVLVAERLRGAAPEPALRRVCRVVREALGCDGASVTVVGQAQTTVASEGLEPPPELVTVPLRESFCARAIASGEPLAVCDAAAHPWVGATELARQGWVVAYLGVPLATRRGELVGALCAFHDEPHAWSADELAALAELARWAAVELELRLTDLVGDAERAKEAFLSEARDVLSRAVAESEVLARLADLAAPRLADSAVAYRHDPQAGLRPVAARHGRPADGAGPIGCRPVVAPLDPGSADGMAGVLRSLASVDADLVDAGRGAAACLPPWPEPGGATAVLPVGDGPAGTLVLCNHEGRELGAEDLEWAEALCAQAVAPLRHAGALADRERVIGALQRPLRPPPLPEVPGLDLAAVHEAADGDGLDVGGDFYEAVALGERRWVLALGDVVGRGAHAAALTGPLRAVLRATAGRGLTEALAAANRFLLDSDARVGPSGPTPSLCTLLLVEVEVAAEGVRATVSSAGHPLPYLRRADGKVGRLGEPGTVLGVVDAPDLALRQAALEEGTTLVAVTDGWLERRSHAGELFDRHLPDALTGLDPGSAEEALERVRRAAAAFSAPQPRDDVAAWAVRVVAD